MNDIQKYLEDNPNIKSQVVSKNNNYTSIIVRPTLHTNMTETVNTIKPAKQAFLNMLK